MFIAGPAVVQRGLGEDVDKEALGGAHLHARESGAVDNEAQSEDDAFAQIRCFLSYLPSNAWAQPPRLASTDDPGRRDDELIRIVPRNRRRAGDVRALLAHVVDRGSPFEMARHYGPSLVTAVARRDGYYPAVGVLANDPRQAGGALTTRLRRSWRNSSISATHSMSPW